MTRIVHNIVYTGLYQATACEIRVCVDALVDFVSSSEFASGRLSWLSSLPISSSIARLGQDARLSSDSRELGIMPCVSFIRG
jgi:hypothetical protein